MQITIEIDNDALREALNEVLGVVPNKPATAPLAEVLPIKPYSESEDELDELLADVPVDNAGVPFDENLHSGIDKFNNDGTWRKKRVAKPKSQYKAEKDISFTTLMEEFSKSKLTNEQFDAAVKALKLDNKQLYQLNKTELYQLREKLFS